MATEIPPSMKVFAPFIIRAHQMEKADPVISYFCYVYVVQQALAKELTKSAEGMTYTAHIMDTLEQRKMQLGDSEAVTDDIVGKIYVEQFANKIFTNAENAQNARRCTKQTAETFMAAAVFLELLRVFVQRDEEFDPEIAKKIVFAKYSASRILKALKAGEDPNLPEEELPEEQPPTLLTESDPSKPYEVSPISPVSPHPPGPTVEDTVDDSVATERAMARMSTTDESLHPSRMMTPSGGSVPPAFPSPPETQAAHHPSAHLPGRQETMSTSDQPFPTPPPQLPSTGYFPPVQPSGPYIPYNTHETSVTSPSLDLPSTPHTLPSAPTNLPSTGFSSPGIPTGPPSIPSLPSRSPPPTFASSTTSSGPENFYAGGALGGVGVGQPSLGDIGGPPATNWLGQSSPPPNAPAVNHHPAVGSSYYYSPPPQTGTGPSQTPSVQPYSQPLPTAYQRAPATIPAQAPPPPPPPPQSQRRLINPDDDPDAVAKAQKHARWAVSALNYDDVATAVKELHLALQTLGAE